MEVVKQTLTISPNEEKLALMQTAMSDPMFVADLEEVHDDFRHADHDEVIG